MQNPNRDNIPEVYELRGILALLMFFMAAAVLWGAVAPWLGVRPSSTCEQALKFDPPLKGPFTRQGTFAYLISVPGTEGRSDNPSNPTRSTAVLCEHGKPLGAAHSDHDEIREKGAGRYSHWVGALYFSTSDNTDPNANGRSYHLILR